MYSSHVYESLWNMYWQCIINVSTTCTLYMELFLHILLHRIPWHVHKTSIKLKEFVPRAKKGFLADFHNKKRSDQMLSILLSITWHESFSPLEDGAQAWHGWFCGVPIVPDFISLTLFCRNFPLLSGIYNVKI